MSWVNRSRATRWGADFLGAVARLAGAGLVVLGLGLDAVPSALRAAVQEGQAALDAGDFETALAAYRRGYLYQPWADARLAALVEAEMLAGDYPAAGRDLACLAGRRPLSPDEMVWWGNIYAGQGRMDEAASAWERAWTAGAINPQALEALARHYLGQGDERRARAVLEELARLGTGEADLLVRLGLMQAFDVPSQAIQTLAQAAVIAPDEAPRLAPMLETLEGAEAEPPGLRSTRLGVALLQMGELELAETAFARAVAYNPAYGEALAYLAYTRAALDRPALSAAEQAVAISPENPTVHYLAGQTWKLLGRPIEARLAFEQAFDLDRSNPVFAVEIASTHRMQAQHASAEAWMLEAVRLSGDDFRFRLLLAQFYVDDEYRLAEEGLPRALALVAEEPDSAEAHATLGWAYFLLGRLPEAFASLGRALVLDPELPRANAHWAAMLESQGRLSEAIGYYQRASELDPDGPFGAFARRALERISES